MSRFHVTLALLVTLALVRPASVTAEDPESVAVAVARPLSAGAVALLLPHAHRPEGAARLVEALGHDQLDVRAVAARVAFATRHELLVPALVVALGKEQTSLAGSELVRALTLIKGSAADDLIMAALGRLGPPASVAWLEVVGRTRPLDVLGRLSALPAGADLSIGMAVSALAQTHPAEVARALAVPTPDPAIDIAYSAVLRHGQGSLDGLPWAVIQPALDAPRHRAAAVLLVQARRIRGFPVLPEAASAVDALAQRVPDEASWTRVLVELVRRSHGGPATSLVPLLGSIDIEAAPWGLWTSGVLETLDSAEAAALRSRAGVLWPARVGRTAPGGPPPPVLPRLDGSAPRDRIGSVTRTPRPLASGLMQELADLAGCRPGTDQMTVLGAAYRPTGQVRQIFTHVAAPNARCAQAARILTALDVAPGEGPVAAERADIVLAGFRPADLRCERAPRRGASRMARLGDPHIQPPKKVRHVNPHYPQTAQSKGIQGVVIIEASIPPAGCVAEAVVRRSVDSALDLAALTAVTQWQYEPARLNGEEVAVQMTVTVNFTLNP